MTTQTLLSVLIFIFSTPAFSAQGQIRMACATQHLTTSYSLLEFDDHFELQVAHHLGLKYMPIHQGLITVNDLKTLTAYAEMFSLMGEQIRVHFPKDRCKLNEGEWSCFRPGRFMIGDLEVESLGFSIYQRRVSISGWEYSTRVVRFSPRVGREVFTLPMEYDEANCRFY